MRCFAMVATLILVSGGVAGAQQTVGGPQSGRGLFAGITLTAEQQHQADSIWAAHQPLRDAMRATRQPGQGMDSARIEHRATMREQLRQSYRAILTPTQQPIFDRNVERMHQWQSGGTGPCAGRRAGGGSGLGGRPGPNR